MFWFLEPRLAIAANDIAQHAKHADSVLVVC